MKSISASCFEIVEQLDKAAQGNLTHENIVLLWSCCERVSNSEVESNYGKPMVWIGIYIAVASLFCVLAMTLDLLHGFKSRKFWFPCKYFTLNATSITIITIAMKLPVDLNTPTNYIVDLLARLGSLVFMSTMIANLMPSLASMDNNELLANATSLVILVITLIVNTLIEFRTRLLPSYLAIWYWLSVLACLLILLISIVISFPTIKKILEFKYQVANKAASTVISQNTKFEVEELKQYLKRYWVMARTSNPQYVMASTPLCCAATIVNVSGVVSYLFNFSFAMHIYYRDYNSDYRWSMLVIFITQGIGIAVGNIAPLVRCFAAFSTTWIISHLKIFKIENYWTLKLFEWKESHLAFPSNNRQSKALVHNLKNLILWLCIGFQKVIVVICKMIGLVQVLAILFMSSLYHVKSLKAKLSRILLVETRHNMVVEPNLSDTNNEIRNYVLQLEDETKLAERSLKKFSNSFNHLMRKAEKEHLPKNLIHFLKKSIGFEGVECFDSDQVEPLPFADLVSCWSLPVVTLTCIAIALPGVGKDVVNYLVDSVSEGLSYTRLVDEKLKNSHCSVNIQKLINNLWDEVEVNSKWLENTLKGNTYEGKSSKEVVKFFNDKAKEVVAEIQNNTNEAVMENSRHKLIAAYSMYRITETVMLNKRSVIEENSGDQVFDMLSCMIADILVACLTNLPRVIVIRCQESVIEKREDSVEAAAELLGRAKEIINNIQMRELPNMDPNLTSIQEWHDYLNALP